MVVSGLDMVSIKRVENICQRRPAFIDKILTPSERKYCLSKAFPYKSVAARFAAKEAFYKAAYPLGARFYFQDIEIELSSKYPALSSSCAAGKFISGGGYKCSISMTHEEDMAAAVAVITK